MNEWKPLAIALTLIAIGGALILIIVPAPRSPIDTVLDNNATTTPAATSTTPGLSDLIVVNSPKAGGPVSSTTLTVAGKARGTWYFEASFPIQIKNASGTVIAQGPAQAQGDWMTADFVPFAATLSYPAQPAGSHGTIVFKNDNPSGDPARDKSLEVPVVFN